MATRPRPSASDYPESSIPYSRKSDSDSDSTSASRCGISLRVFEDCGNCLGSRRRRCSRRRSESALPAAFSVYWTVMLLPLPFRDAGRFGDDFGVFRLQPGGPLRTHSWWSSYAGGGQFHRRCAAGQNGVVGYLGNATKLKSRAIRKRLIDTESNKWEQPLGPADAVLIVGWKSRFVNVVNAARRAEF
jgi:hypothetical protein